jgi:hypothetical protein
MPTTTRRTDAEDRLKADLAAATDAVDQADAAASQARAERRKLLAKGRRMNVPYNVLQEAASLSRTAIIKELAK